MRLLWVAPYLPYPPAHGGKVRVFNLLARLAARHEVHLLAADDRATTGDPAASNEPLSAACASVTLMPWRQPHSLPQRIAQTLSPLPFAVAEVTTPEGKRALAGLLAAHRFDAAVVEQVQAAEYLPVLRRAGVPALLVCHNVERRIWQGFAKYPPNFKKKVRAELEVLRLRRYEPRALRAATARLAVSEEDRQQLERMGHVLCGLSPNGVDIDYFTFQPRPERGDGTPWRLVMTGSMSYAPNIDAAEYFAAEILPRVRALHPVQTRFVGSSPAPQLLTLQEAAWEREGDAEALRFTGFVADVRPYVAGADLFIAPLRHGSGTRLKLLEAMAQGIPVATTSAGREGLEVEHGTHIWIADTPEAFAEGIATLMGDDALRQHLARNARALVEQRYSWERIASDLEAELMRIARPTVANAADTARSSR